MIIVKEKHNGNEIFFEMDYVKDDKIVHSNEIYFHSAVVEKDGKTYLYLYDKDMSPISSTFSFLNFGCAKQSLNSRLKSLQALKFLYCFQEIISKKLEHFTIADVNNLKSFLKGYSLTGDNLSFELSTIRSNDTLNSYLSVYRKYLNYLGKENVALSDKATVTSSLALPGYDIDLKTERYTSNEKVAKKVVEVPRYISVEEFQTIIKVIREKYTTREEIIVRLMYQCGLRIGECLGITADDLVMENIGELYVPMLYIRNRVSDQKYQFAKGCMKVGDVKQYKSKEYKTKNYGYQTVVIPEDLFDLINEYIETEHLKARKTHKENYYASTIADRVRKAEKYEDDNYYVFLNSIGRPISDISWNGILRNIFKDCNITVDKVLKEHNLNHRFRHGFAMFNVMYLGCKELELKERLRHNSVTSVAYYFRPTTSDMIELKTKFAEDLYKVIPELERK